ncbi:hypothetical protein SAMN05216281_1488 [Cryobacterium luteum]|nr:hypothetical protein SAMN05216281_1488 [Cryobacterium luteum]
MGRASVIRVLNWAADMVRPSTVEGRKVVELSRQKSR